MYKSKITKLALGLFIFSSAVIAAAVEFQAVEGETNCPSGFAQVTSEIALNYRDPACRAIGSYPGARLTGKNAMSGSSGGCNISRGPVTMKLPATLCYRVDFQVSNIDNSCPDGTRLATVKEAAILNAQACDALKNNQWYIARLANQGSIGGSAYSCGVNAIELKPLGNSLCVKP
jgi:hypothetical protein